MLICKKWFKRYERLPDAVVVEGPMAGGHLGFKSEQLEDPAYALERLVPEAVAAVAPFEKKHGRTIPVIAAGGVYTGADIHRFLEMGAAGVQLGTRFVATDECDAAPEFKKLFVEAAEKDIVVINSPVGMPGRAICNPFLDAVKNGEKNPRKCVFHCIRTCDPENSPYCIALALANARRGKFGYGFAFAGQNAHRVDGIVPVKALMDELMCEYAEAVRKNRQN